MRSKPITLASRPRWPLVLVTLCFSLVWLLPEGEAAPRRRGGSPAGEYELRKVEREAQGSSGPNGTNREAIEALRRALDGSGDWPPITKNPLDPTRPREPSVEPDTTPGTGGELVPPRPPPPAELPLPAKRREELAGKLQSFSKRLFNHLTQNDDVAVAKAIAESVWNMDLIAEAIGLAKMDPQTARSVKNKLSKARDNPARMTSHAELNQLAPLARELVQYYENGALNSSILTTRFRSASRLLKQIQQAQDEPTIEVRDLLPDPVLLQPAVLDLMEHREQARRVELARETIHQLDLLEILNGPTEETTRRRAQLAADPEAIDQQQNSRRIVEKVAALTVGSQSVPCPTAMIEQLVRKSLGGDWLDTSAQNRRTNKAILAYVVAKARELAPSDIPDDPLLFGLQNLDSQSLQELLQAHQAIERLLLSRLGTVPDDQTPLIKARLAEVRAVLVKITSAVQLTVKPLERLAADKRKVRAVRKIEELLRPGISAVRDLAEVRKLRLDELDREKATSPLSWADRREHAQLSLDGLEAQSEKLQSIQKSLAQSPEAATRSQEFQKIVTRLRIAIKPQWYLFPERAERLMKKWEVVTGKPRGPPTEDVSTESAQRIDPLRPYFDPELEILFRRILPQQSRSVSQPEQRL